MLIVISLIGAVISFSGATAHKGDNSENTLPADSFISHCSPYSDSGDLSLFTIPANALTGSAGGQRTPTRLTYSSRTSRTSGRSVSAAIAGCGSAVGYMIFPISTPPNAIAASTGLVQTKDMAKVGIIVGVIGYVLGFLWLTKLFPFPMVQ